jgi:hypothetical protein
MGLGDCKGEPPPREIENVYVIVNVIAHLTGASCFCQSYSAVGKLTFDFVLEDRGFQSRRKFGTISPQSQVS